VITTEAITADYEAHRLLYIRFARQFRASREAAEDLVQTAFTVLLSDPQKLRDPAKIKSFMMVTIRFAALNLLHARAHIALDDPDHGGRLRINTGKRSILTRLIQREQLAFMAGAPLRKQDARVLTGKILTRDHFRGPLTHAESCSLTRVRRAFRKRLPHGLMRETTGACASRP
jgi:hypothetical protein